MSNRENLSEEDIKLRYITPVLEKAGWTKKHIRMEYVFTEGQILVRGKIVERGKRKKADYLLRKDGKFPFAVVEAKNLNIQPTAVYNKRLIMQKFYICRLLIRRMERNLSNTIS